MAPTLGLLALFALFTIGSAETDIVCTADTTNCRVNDEIGACYKAGGSSWACKTDCKTNGAHCGPPTMMGTCTAGKCNSVVRGCKEKMSSVFCRDGSNSVGTCSGDSGNHCVTTGLCTETGVNMPCGGGDLTGTCPTQGGLCKYDEVVMVAYTIEASPGLGSVVSGDVEDSNFNPGLDSKLSDHTVKDGGVTCDVAAKPEAPAQLGGKVACSGKLGEACTLTCDDKAKRPKDFTKVCKHNRQWDGDYGTCEIPCDLTRGTYVPATGKFLVTDSTIVPAPGDATVECDSPFPDTKCYVVCKKAGERVMTQTTVTCDSGDKKWSVPADTNFKKGACGPSIDVHASATILTAHGDDHVKMVQLRDKDFNKKFKAAVLANLPVGVLEANVIIKSITVVPHEKTSGQRRLNETSVQVDYTIRKSDPEGATELDKIDDDHLHFPEDDGLPVGGLRGTRL